MEIFLFIGFITIGVVSSQNFGCPPTGIHAIPYPHACRRYIRCLIGVGFEQTCAPGLSFDIVRGTCNTEEQANCNPCRANGAGQITFTRDPFNCARFTSCVGEVAYEQTCAEGLYFDPTINSCARSETVECPNPSTPPVNPPPSPDPPGSARECDLDRNFEIIASPFSCENYTICTSGHPNKRTCPHGLIFDIVANHAILHYKVTV